MTDWRGMTSNPAIFEKAIATSKITPTHANHVESKKLDAKAIFERIAFRDVILAGSDSFFEDGGIRGHAAQSVIVDHFLQAPPVSRSRRI